MSIKSLILCFMMILGGFMYFNISPLKLIEEINNGFSTKHISIKDQVKKQKHKKKQNEILDVILSAKNTLTMSYSGNHYPIYCLASVILFVVGIIIGTLLDNQLAAIVLGLGLAYTPFLLIRYLSYNYQNQLLGEMKTVLTNIRGTYLENDNYIYAVKENLPDMKGQLKEVFEAFVNEVENFNVPVVVGIRNMRHKVDNDIWLEWCDTTIICQDNKNFRGALTPINNRLSDIQITTEKQKVRMQKPLKDLLTIDSILIGLPVFFYIASNEWYTMFMNNPLGKVVFAADLAVFFIIAHGGVIKLKPIAYKR